MFAYNYNEFGGEELDEAIWSAFVTLEDDDANITEDCSLEAEATGASTNGNNEGFVQDFQGDLQKIPPNQSFAFYEQLARTHGRNIDARLDMAEPIQLRDHFAQRQEPRYPAHPKGSVQQRPNNMPHSNRPEGTIEQTSERNALPFELPEFPEISGRYDELTKFLQHKHKMTNVRFGPKTRAEARRWFLNKPLHVLEKYKEWMLPRNVERRRIEREKRKALKQRKMAAAAAVAVDEEREDAEGEAEDMEVDGEEKDDDDDDKKDED